MSARPPLDLGVIGAGRAASALLPRWRAAGHRVLWQHRRGDGIPLEDLAPAPVLVIAVPDGVIADCARALAQRPSAPRELWLHLSGSLPASVLRGAAARPRSVACLHPLVALTGEPAEPPPPLDAIAGIDGEAEAAAVAEALAIDAGLRPRRIAPDLKPLYHAAAVTVAGHATALFAQAMRLIEAAGIPEGEGREALAALLRSAADNLTRGRPAEVITGPSTRGDIATIAAHLKALRELGDARAEATYRLLAAEAADLGDEATASSLAQVLGT